jgi:hypothetical protein
MRMLRLPEEAIEPFLAYIKANRVWSNGLVGRETYYYLNGRVEVERQDMREPEYGPWTTVYSEDEFRDYLRRAYYVEWVYDGIMKLISGGD